MSAPQSENSRATASTAKSNPELMSLPSRDQVATLSSPSSPGGLDVSRDQVSLGIVRADGASIPKPALTTRRQPFFNAANQFVGNDEAVVGFRVVRRCHCLSRRRVALSGSRLLGGRSGRLLTRVTKSADDREDDQQTDHDQEDLPAPRAAVPEVAHAWGF